MWRASSAGWASKVDLDMVLFHRSPASRGANAQVNVELPRRWVTPRGVAGFLDTHRDTVIGVAAITAAFGAVLGAVAGGIAGSHPHYHVLTGGFMLVAYALFGVAGVILLTLLAGSIAVTRARSTTRARLADAIEAGYVLYREALQASDEVRPWKARVTEWELDVGDEISALLGKASVMVFENDVDLQDPGTVMDDDRSVDNTHRTQRLRLARRIQNLHRLMAAT